MIGIDRYNIRQTALQGSQKNLTVASTSTVTAQHPPVLLSGGAETGRSSNSKLSAAFWSIQSAGKGGEDGTDTPEAEFTKLSKMTLAERIRAQILEKHHLTEQDFKSLSDSDRKAIEDEIRQAILKAYGAEGGEGEKPDALGGAVTPASQPPASQASGKPETA